MSDNELLELQKAIKGQGFTWTAGPTSLSALPPHEQERRLGLRLIPHEMQRLASIKAAAAPVATDFPAAWDWRDVEGANWTTAIRDQGACGACVAFGVVAVLETMLKLHLDKAGLQPDLSEAHLFFCGCGDCCDKGWWPSYALDYARDYGLPDEACFPYQDHDCACSDGCSDWQERAVRFRDWQEIMDVGQRKAWLARTGPMVACMAVYRDFFSYTGGIYRHVTGDLAGYHAVGVVGYSEEEQCWICKNSWGIGWGEAGWFKIGYGECKVDSEFAMYGVEGVNLPEPGPTPPPPPPPPPQPGCNLWARLVRALRRE